MQNRSPSLVRKSPSMRIEMRMSSMIAISIIEGISTPTAIEKRKTPFSMTRNPTMCEKMRVRTTMRISPLSRA